MKVYQVVAVFDNLSETFLQPTFVESVKEAERLFTYQINNIKLWKDNASDYELYKLGEYDAENGMLVSELHKLIKGTSVVRKENEIDIQSVQTSTEEENTGRNNIPE